MNFNPVTGKSFQLSVLIATFLPLVVAVGLQITSSTNFLLSSVSIASTIGLTTIFGWMGTLASAHVFSSVYLLFNPREFRGVPNSTLVLVILPAFLFALTFLMLLAVPLWATLTFMLVYVHYAMWHFGRQNLGVYSFVIRISLNRPMHQFERKTIMAGVIAGVCASYSLLAPALMLNPKGFPLDVSNIDHIFSKGWYLGAAINAVLVPVTIFHVWNHRHKYDFYSGATYLVSVFFFLPIFITSSTILNFVWWQLAHGLQYLVFLTFHAAGKPRPLLPLIFLSVAIYSGYVIWQFLGTIQASDDLSVVKIAVATLSAITLVHYATDQFLWRFSTPERRAWLAENYSFLSSRKS